MSNQVRFLDQFYLIKILILQAIALALECIPFFCLVNLFSDSQAALDVYKTEFLLAHPDFKNQCWIEQRYIANIVHKKNLDVNWIKIKGHSDVSSNERADVFARIAAFSSWQLLYMVSEHFLRAGGSVVSGNSKHFVCDVFHSVYHARWEVGSGSKVVVNRLCTDIDWSKSSSVWHPDFHLATGFTSAQTAGFWMYFMKALYYRLPVAVHKCVYNKCYSSVACLFCEDVKVSDHVFSCPSDAAGRAHLVDVHTSIWKLHSGLSQFFSCVLQLLSTHFSDVIVSTALCKGFVFCEWYHESVSIFKDSKVAAQNIVAFVHDFCLAFQDDIWLAQTKHQAFMKKGELILHDGSVPVAVSGLFSVLSASVVRLLGIADAFGVGFGYHRCYLFFSGIRDKTSVHIGV
ncbi:hypothetical protein G9A89_004307 [Geosiphon pyriformis]|nr:hypothetical protein G9A89_004307 [Geosiphon pyriformis]